jgi:phosphate transport system substrate-binding protein
MKARFKKLARRNVSMRRFALATAVLALGALLAGSAIAAEQLVINGSTTVLPIAQAAAEQFMKANPDITVSVSGGGSGNGIKALIDGTANIANSSRFIKQEEVKMAVEKGRYPVPFGVAIDAIIPVVHPSNTIADLTIEQLHDIYAGKIKNWKELGGQDRPIAVVSRDTSSGTYEVWEEKVLKGDRVAPQALIVASNGAMVQTVAGNPAAIGYIGIGYLSDELKTITVNGITGSIETARSGEYPVSRYLFMFTGGWPTGAALKFINFVMSDEGQKIVADEGFVPIR